jgi:hypothetical protein
MLLGMRAKTSEREKPPFETSFETSRASPFDPPRISLGKQGPLKGQARGCARKKANQLQIPRPSYPHAQNQRALGTPGVGPRDDSSKCWAKKTALSKPEGAAPGGLGMAAKTSEREKPPFEAPFKTQGPLRGQASQAHYGGKQEGVAQ